MPTTLSSEPSLDHEEVTPAQEILPTSPLYMPPANVPPTKPLVMDDKLASNWNAWKKAWTRYEVATGVNKQEQLVRVSTLLSVIREDATKAFDAFEWGRNRGQLKNKMSLQSSMNSVSHEHRSSTNVIDLIIVTKNLEKASHHTLQN